MKIKEIVNALEQFAPLPLQDSYDNAGLQIGLTDAKAAGALLCLDVTEKVIDEAIAHGCNMIISHHPLLFKGYKSITGKDYIERCIIKAIKNDIVIYSAHTNLDNAHQGVNFKIAEKLGLENISILQPQQENLLKLVVFVPLNHADNLRNSLFNAGCGTIGNYDSCSFNLTGEGTFRAQAAAHPYCGAIGKHHHEEEVRIEMILPKYKKRDAIDAIYTNHPYEEPAFDFYALENIHQQVGAGVIGDLPEPCSELTILEKIKQNFEVEALQHNKLCGRFIKRVALCGGAGSFLIPQAMAKNADLFITGEVKYHDFFGYEEQLLIAAIGHYQSEQYTREIFYSILHEKFPKLFVKISEINTNPIKYL